MPSAPLNYLHELLLFIGNFIHVYNVFRSCILPITLQFIPVLLHFPFCVKPTKSISAICINRGEGPLAMFISTSWPMTTLGTAAQKQHNSFHHTEVSFDMAPFPFNSPLVDLLDYGVAHLLDTFTRMLGHWSLLPRLVCNHTSVCLASMGFLGPLWRHPATSSSELSMRLFFFSFLLRKLFT